MNLIIIGGVSAEKMKAILANSADNVNVTILPDILAFLNQASTRNMSVDRIFLMQEAYKAVTGNPQPTLDSLNKFVTTQYPSVRLLCLGADKNILTTFAQTFISPNHATFSVARATGTFITDLAVQPIEVLTSRYTNQYIKYDVGNVMSYAEQEQPVASIPAQTPVQKPAAQPKVQEKKSLFGRRKSTSPSNAGTSPAAPLTPSQSGFGGNTSSPAGSFPSGGAQINNNPFSKGTNNNPFASGGQNAQPAGQQVNNNPFGSNPFSSSNSAHVDEPTQAQSAEQPAKQKSGGLFGVKKNPFARAKTQEPQAQAEQAQPSANADNGLNGFGVKSRPNNSFSSNSPNVADAPTTGTTNPFGGQSSGFPATNNNPFAQSGDNPTVTKTKFNTRKPFEPSSQSSADEVASSMGSTGFGSPFMEDRDSSVANVDEVEEVGSGFETPAYNNPFGSREGTISENSAVSQGSKIPGQSGGFGVRQGGLEEARRPVQNQSNFGSSFNNSGLNAQNSGTPLNNGNPQNSSYGMGAGELLHGNEIEEIDEISAGIPPLEPMGNSRKLDMSRLQGNVHNNYDFKGATQVNRGVTTRRENNVEEVSGITAAPVSGYIDDSEYQQQFAPAPRVVEKIVEREVYIDSGTETPAQKLLDAGKQVIIVVTGDRRSGVTLTALTLAQIYAKRVSTLVVDLDTETCGGQLYQDLEELMSEDENVLHGLTRAKNPTLLSNLTFHSNSDGYDYLFSLLGNGTITNDELRGLQNALIAQRQFQLVIIDCPWNRLSAIEDLFMSAKILLCVDPDVSGCYNITRMLDRMPISGRFVTAVERAGGYVAKPGTAPDNLIHNMQWLSDMFKVDGVNWAELRILGSADRNNLPDVMKKL